MALVRGKFIQRPDGKRWWMDYCDEITAKQQLLSRELQA